MPMVRAGFAVVATDYHGLGTPGPHEYVNKLAQARDVVYSVPAAHRAVPSLGRRWVAVGHSQGGVAMWGVAEREALMHDPDYLGAVSVAGSGDLRVGLERMAASGDAAAFYLAYMAYAVHARSPAFRADQMLVGRALGHYRAATTRGCWYYAYASYLDAHDGPLLRSGWEGNPAVQQFIDDNRMGEAPMARPFLVVAGEADQTVPFALVQKTVARACAAGHPLALRTYPGLDHSETMRESTADILEWISDRFADRPVTGECAAPQPP
jgi:pimeloyl-ACP methyl ester carboxylesterase